MPVGFAYLLSRLAGGGRIAEFDGLNPESRSPDGLDDNFVKHASRIDVGCGRCCRRISGQGGSAVLESEQSLFSCAETVQGNAKFLGGIAGEPEGQGLSGLQGCIARTTALIYPDGIGGRSALISADGSARCGNGQSRRSCQGKSCYAGVDPATGTDTTAGGGNRGGIEGNWCASDDGRRWRR